MNEHTTTTFPERPDAFDLSAFDCPRCTSVTSAESYGPCARCVAELQATVRGEASTAVAGAYEPKVHVTPNAVALRDD